MEKIADLFIAFVVGAFICFVFVIDDIHNGATELLIDCEKTLPRTEKCVLIAVPENTKGNNDGTYTR